MKFTAAQVNQLSEQLAGHITLPQDPAYPVGRTTFMNAFQNFPQLIVYCQGFADVVRSIAFAKAVDHGHRKEIFVADWDGHNQRQVTHNTNLDLLPTWAPYGSGVLYTRYENNHPDLVELMLGTSKNRVLPSRRTTMTSPE